ncbi:G protein-activated inward rectifier potassium channel 3-like [Frankliniella occidentalis]|uniref:G protein-activated inward rectifier potassium channel 3-like n=1 Tax=Frankliniella occidentalis TaxID=133901 RepID=A0A6J1S4J1_FRAOC|nr:G protein-activated inward rectifier potassium channel 3-like [Frankliniella occidentalis]
MGWHDDMADRASLLRPSRSHPEVRPAPLSRRARDKSLSERGLHRDHGADLPMGFTPATTHHGSEGAHWAPPFELAHRPRTPPRSRSTVIHLEDDARASDAATGAHSQETIFGFKRWYDRWRHQEAGETRAINKNGTCNVTLVNNVDRNRRFMQDLFNTLVDCRWRYTLLAFVLSYVVSWLIFALIWYLIAAAHGDLRRTSVLSSEDSELPDSPPCVVNMNDFTQCFLYSVESQMTIGYGTSYPSQECPEAIFVLCMQSILGLIIQAFTVGMVFAKLTRPKRRSQTLLFSRRAVVTMRDSRLCLQFRVADIRKTHMVDARLRAHLLHTRCTAEGEYLAPHRTELKLSVDSAHGKLFLIWPLVAVHRIDQNSPLYFESAEDLIHSKYEILVFLEGTIESTGQVVQARSSYVPAEVLWGHRFEPVVRYDRFLQSYEVDHSRLDHTVQVDAPLCSAYELDQLDLLVGQSWTRPWAHAHPPPCAPAATPPQQADGHAYYMTASMCY